MLLSHRRRRNAYMMRGMPGERRYPWGRLITILVLLFLAYFLVSRVLRFFGVGNPVERTAAMISVDSGVVNVSLDGASPQRAESGMKIYSGDKIISSGGAHAILTMFDGTRIRMDENAELSLEESTRGKETSILTLKLDTGRLWVETPMTNTTSGSIVRTLQTPGFTYTFPERTQALVSPLSLAVFSAAGLGVQVESRRHDPIVIGEGQKWMVENADSLSADLYSYRSPIDAGTVQLPFVVSSQTLLRSTPVNIGTGTQLSEALLITSPEQNAELRGTSITIAGRVGPGVTKVEIDGRTVPIDAATRSFTQTMMPPDGTGDITIEIQALDDTGTLLASTKRVVKRSAVSIFAPPTIDSPAKAGETYRTSKEEFVMRGTAPKGTTGIMVNDYALQLFDPEKGTWSYLAATRLSNLKQGQNVFNVYALYGGNNGIPDRSPAATLTILLEDGPEGVVTPGTSSSSTTGTATSSTKPQNNAPLTPGVVKVMAPDLSVPLRGTGTLIEGVTSAGTDSIWVNDYRLQLYKAGKTTWNYIASPELKNVKEGKNTFVVIARNAKGEVLDRLEFTLEYRP